MKGDKHTFVGQFFEELGQKILGGELTRDDDGDICLRRKSTTVEVKASGFQSSYGFRLSLEQIGDREQACRMAFEYGWYMLFAYKNRSIRQGKGRRTELAPHVTSESVRRYLSASAMWCVAVDLSIVGRWRDTLPHSTKSIMGHLGVKTVDIKCRYLTVLASHPRSGLEGLGLDAMSYGILSGVVETSGEDSVQIPVTMILKSSQVLSVKRMLRRRGFHFESRSI